MKNKNWIISILDDGGYLSIGRCEGWLFDKDGKCVRVMNFTQANHLIHTGAVVRGDEGVYVRGNDIEIPYSTHAETKIGIDNADRGYGTKRRMGD